MEYLNVVMEYFDETLYSLNKKYLKNFSNIPPLLVKLYTYQMFRALNYLNALGTHKTYIGIAHRDIKPFNILINPHSNKLVICDFGSAKQLVKSTDAVMVDESNIAYICSRCYRAP
jgi:glycogen synthase kinase 3 beta